MIEVMSFTVLLYQFWIIYQITVKSQLSERQLSETAGLFETMDSPDFFPYYLLQ